MYAAQMVIGAGLLDGTASFESVNPYTRQPWATVPEATEADVDFAVESAAAAFSGGWGTSPGLQRATLMHRLADLLDGEAERMSTLESTDNGKVIRETRNQMHFAARNLRFFAGYADKLYGSTIPLDRPGAFDYTLRRPYGVCGLITAWNSPIALLANKLPPALAAGNTVVIKPSEHASVTTTELAKLALTAGFPPGVVNVVTGAAPAGTALTAHPAVAKLSFTGGTRTGAAVALQAARRTVPLTLELGGKSPNIIFDDADFDRAITGAIAGIFAASGQTCIAGSRLLVHRPIYAAALEALTARASAIKLGDPLDPVTEMGPVANEPQFRHVLGMIDSARGQGATLLTGGRPADGPGLGQGLFVEPTIFADVTPDMPLAQEEVFGPVLAVIPFDSEQDAIKIANSTQYGLAAGIWTRDVSRAHRLVEAVGAGTVWVNTYRSTAAQAPFGGTRASGYGRERGAEALNEYTYVKNVMIDYSGEARDPFSIRV